MEATMKTILLILFTLSMALGQTPSAKPSVPVKPSTKLNQLEVQRLKVNAIRLKMLQQQVKQSQDMICKTHGQAVGCTISTDMTTIVK
jgi:hypothetical protein